MKKSIILIIFSFSISILMFSLIHAESVCGNNICEYGEARIEGGCGPNADPTCLGPPTFVGTCPEDCVNVNIDYSCSTDADCVLSVPSEFQKCHECEPFGCRYFQDYQPEVVAVNKDWMPSCPPKDPRTICPACIGGIVSRNSTAKCVEGQCTKVSQETKVCTKEAKMCPDGSSVGRNSSNNCEFDPCNSEIITDLCEIDNDCKYFWYANNCHTPEFITKGLEEAKKNNMTIFEDFNGRDRNVTCKCIENKCNAIDINNTIILPEVASQKAEERLGELGFTIVLKEVGNSSIYVATANHQYKILGLIKKNATVEVEVDAETGNIIKVNKPWWTSISSK